MQIEFRNLQPFDNQQRMDILNSMHYKKPYHIKSLKKLELFNKQHGKVFNFNHQSLKLYIKYLNDYPTKKENLQARNTIEDNFLQLSKINNQAYEFLMRLLTLIATYSSLTLWQIVNWFQLNYQGHNVFSKVNKQKIYTQLTILSELNLIKQIDFSYTPHYIHGIVNDKKTLIENHNKKFYHAYLITDLGVSIFYTYLNNFLSHYLKRSYYTSLSIVPLSLAQNDLWKSKALQCWEAFNWQIQLYSSGLANLLIMPNLYINYLNKICYQFGWRDTDTLYTVTTFFSDYQSKYLNSNNFIDFDKFKLAYGTDLFMNQNRNENNELVSYQIPVKKLALLPKTVKVKQLDKKEVENIDAIGNYYLSNTWQPPQFYMLDDPKKEDKSMQNQDHLFHHIKNAPVVNDCQYHLSELMRHFNDLSDLF